VVLLVILGLTLAAHACVGAAAPPDRGGTITWAVHEGMPHFDSHVDGSSILAQPVGPLYNSLLTFDLYENETIVGDLAEGREIAPDGKQITFALARA
jgi:ABC-type oligopeptide transport system substrate-binding subunit